MPSINQEALPSRHRESAFRFYEKSIAEMMSRFPLVTTFDPRRYHRSMNTFSARFRDAMWSYFTYHWESTLIDRVAFCKAFDTSPRQIVVSERKGLIYVGGREQLHSDIAVENSPDAHVVRSEYSPAMEANAPFLFDSPLRSFAEFEILCYLAAQRQLKAPLLVTITSPSWVEVALQKYDIDLDKGENNQYSLT